MGDMSLVGLRPNGAQITDDRFHATRDLPPGYRVVPTSPGFAVTVAGRVRSFVEEGHERYWKKVTPTKNDGYLIASVTHRGILNRKFVHRLVLEAFVGPCPEGMLCRHLNGVRDDDRLENLAWGTPLENSADAIRHRGQRERKEHPTIRNAQATIDALKGLAGAAEAAIPHLRTDRQKCRLAEALILARRAIAEAEGRPPED